MGRVPFSAISSQQWVPLLNEEMLGEVARLSTKITQLKIQQRAVESSVLSYVLFPSSRRDVLDQNVQSYRRGLAIVMSNSSKGQLLNKYCREDSNYGWRTSRPHYSDH